MEGSARRRKRSSINLVKSCCSRVLPLCLRGKRDIVVHIAYRESGEFGYGTTQVSSELSAQYNLQAYVRKAAIMELLKSRHAQTGAYLGQLADAHLNGVLETAWGELNRLVEMFGHLIEYQVHHPGE